MLIIKIEKNNIEKALKQFKSKVSKTNLINQINNRKEYIKKSVRRREEIKKAKYKEQSKI
jgi:small subunit ribosomal protein S21